MAVCLADIIKSDGGDRIVAIIIPGQVTSPGGIRVTSCVDYAWSGARAAVRGIISPGFNTFYTQSPGQLRGETWSPRRDGGAPSPPPGSVRTLTDSGNKHEPLSLSF